MDTDYGIPQEVDRVQARVAKIVDGDQGDTEVETWTHTFAVSNAASPDPGTVALPATFSILPGGDAPEREIIIELEALSAGSDEVLVSRRLKTTFISGEARLVRMLLFRACAGQACEAGESCGCPAGAACSTPSCVDESVDPYALEPISNPGALPGDAGIPADAGNVNCAAPLLLCGSDCVNPDADPRYCGDCETSCPSGFVCEFGECMNPGDCRSNGVGCSGFTYCDEATGECLAGCIEAQQCTGEHEVCNEGTHECECAPDFERCGGLCVNTDIDPDYCGLCDRSCPPGHECDDGTCRDPGDCRVNGVGCSGFTYCDEETGLCLRGCEDDEQCVEDNELCDTELHDCACVVDFHRCGPVCVSNNEVDTCGDRCTPCPPVADATAVCVFQACSFFCEQDFERCDDMCCPSVCPPGQALYGGVCAKLHVQTADGAGDVGEYSSLALDQSGLAYVAHYARSLRDLAVSIQQSDGTWLTETPDGNDDVGTHTSIALDGDSLVHVAYYNENEGNLMLASQDGAGAWTIEPVDDQGDVGEYPSLVFDAAGTAHVSYYDGGNKNLKYATRAAGGAWDVTTVDEEDMGQYTSLALDPSGAPHISYYDADSRNLMLASKDPDETWRTRTVAASGNVGKYSSLAFDALGFAHISYYHEGNRDLIYASEGILGFWVFETVESQPNVGKYTSLAFNARGEALISYYDESDRDLKLARRLASGAWSIETIDSDGDVGRYSSLAVDSLGQAHISYRDQTNTNLKYALIAAPAPSTVP